MSKRKAIAILAIIAMVLTLMPAAMFGATNVDRLAGANRIETALKICDAGWKSADTVILAAADEANLVDALAAGPLAAQENAPILVTYKNSLNADVKAKIAALGAKKVIVVGAVSDSVVEELKAIAGVTVEKISGKNRIETANLINAKLKNVAGTFVVGYLGLPDALSVASYAAANNFAIAIAKADGTVNEDSLLGETTYIVGGTARVADIDGATRFAGSDRLATNAAVAEGLEFDFGKVYVANGRTLVDALAVAPLAAKTDSFVLLVEANKGKAVEGMTASTQIIAVGGTAAVPQKVLDNLFGEDDGEFTIKSVKAPNLIQLKLELSNTDYDKDELTDVTNYELEAIAKDQKDVNNIEVAKASVKDTTLTLTLEEPVKNETTGTLTIDKVITGEELIFDDIRFSDHDIPTIEEVKVIGKDTVKFVFSEPINIDEDADVEEFDFAQGDSSFSTKSVKSIKDGLEANVVVFDNFDEGKLTVKVGNGLEDYAGFNIIPKTFEIEVVEDTDAPEVIGYKDAKRDQVTLIFNEDIERLSNDVEDFYHTNSSNHVVQIDSSDDNDVVINGNEMTLHFDGPDNKLPEGTAYVYVKAGAVSDLWDNENNTIKTKVEIDVDNTKPTISKVEWKDNNIVVSYSEGMDGNAEDIDNYTLVDPDGDEVTLVDATFVANSNDKKVALELRNSDPASGTYELTVQKVEDKAGNAITKTTVEVKISDTKALTFDGLTPYYEKYGSERYRIYIEFGEELATSGKYSVLDLDKYEVSADGGENFDNLGALVADDDVYARVDVVDSGKTVRITTDYKFAVNAASGNFIDNMNYIQIVGRVADIAGNYTSAAASKPLEIVEKAPITIDTVSAKSATTLEVVFEGGYLTSYDPADFLVWEDDGDGIYEEGSEELLAVKSVAKGSDPDKAIITLTDKAGNRLPADPTAYVLGTKATTKSKNAAGRLLESGVGLSSDPSHTTIKTQGVRVTDKIAPSILTLDDQNKKDYYKPQDPGNGSSDKVPAVWGTVDKTVTTNPVSVIYIQFNETLRKITSGPGSDVGFTVTVDGKKVTSGVDVETINGEFGPATGENSNSIIKITITGKAIAIGDKVEIGSGVIRDVASPAANASGTITAIVQYPVEDVTP